MAVRVYGYAYARHAKLPIRPTLRRLLPDPPSSTTCPPRATLGLRASPDPGRVPLLILNLMRYARGMAFIKLAWELHAYLFPSSHELMPVYKVSV